MLYLKQELKNEIKRLFDVTPEDGAVKTALLSAFKVTNVNEEPYTTRNGRSASVP